jgi:hypothetical protein
MGECVLVQMRTNEGLELGLERGLTTLRGPTRQQGDDSAEHEISEGPELPSDTASGPKAFLTQETFLVEYLGVTFNSLVGEIGHGHPVEDVSYSVVLQCQC